MLYFHRAAIIPVFVLLLGAVGSSAFAAADHVYLTWRGDTSTTMTVHYHSADQAASRVRYGVAEGGHLAEEATGDSHQIPGLQDGRHIHTVELTDLEPGTLYAFETGNGKGGKFRTLPNDGRDIRGIFGGDVGVFPLAEVLLKQAAKHNPDVAVIGGDIAYANGDLNAILAWDIWFRRWGEHMVREDGAMIPMIHAIGNHEVNKKDSDDPTVRAPFYFGFFDQGGETYFTRALGPHCDLIVLDTGHITPHAEQVDFLKDALKSAQETPFTFAVYHVTQYPSHRSFDDSRSVASRELWQPHFDAYDLSLGFEHHDHTYKRTKPIRANAVHPEGTVYLGDGSMGVAVRSVEHAKAWYMEKAAEKAHFIVVDISEDGVQCRAIDHLGQEFDAVTIAPRLAPAAP